MTTTLLSPSGSDQALDLEPIPASPERHHDELLSLLVHTLETRDRLRADGGAFAARAVLQSRLHEIRAALAAARISWVNAAREPSAG